MNIKKRLLKRQIAGDAFLVPVGKEIYDSNGLFFLSGIGEFIWDRLEQAQSREEILSAILEEYDVQEADARKDLDAFFDKLKSFEIID